MKSTLRLWGASRMMSRSAYIVGTETLGMERKDYGPGAPKSNKILCPPVFSAQMEIIFVTQILEPTKKEILNKLKALVQENNRRSWLAIYLCIFLLLHSCALLTKKDHDRAGEQGVNVRLLLDLISMPGFYFLLHTRIATDKLTRHVSIDPSLSTSFTTVPKYSWHTSITATEETILYIWTGHPKTKYR